MRLFVNDEQGFLRDPGGHHADPEVRERRQSGAMAIMKRPATTIRKDAKVIAGR